MPPHDWKWTLEETLPSRKGAHLDCMKEILAQLDQLGWEKRDLLGIEMALEESLANAIKHGNKYDEAKVVQVACRINGTHFWLEVEDEGEGFTPDEVPDCTKDENLDRCSGRGLMLMEHYMTRVEYNQRGNKVTIELIKD